MGFGVWGLGFGVWGLGFGAWGLGLGVWGLGFGTLTFRVQGCSFLVLLAGSRLKTVASGPSMSTP